MRLVCALFAVTLFLPVEGTLADQSNLTSDVAFNRIIHGWTNYSTAFDTTHDLGQNGEYATLASFYTPTQDVRLLENGVIVVWSGSGGQRFSFTNFSFEVQVWSGLGAFTNAPRQGDVATYAFAGPTGGSVTTPDATTRGGRAAYEIRFALTNTATVLTNSRAYLIGFDAKTFSKNFGELFVPTSSHSGESDVQAGSLVVGGWLNLVDAGGLTIYSGQLATALTVQTIDPRLSIERTNEQIVVSWPVLGNGWGLQSSTNLAFDSNWSPVPGEPIEKNQMKMISLPASQKSQFFRLTR